jgi:hypothetical protein
LAAQHKEDAEEELAVEVDESTEENERNDENGNLGDDLGSRLSY